MPAADGASTPRPVPVGPGDVADVRAFLVASDLTVAGLGSPAVCLWVVRDTAGAVVASTGYETGPDGRHALLRSVAVAPTLRGSGSGSALARFAMEQAVATGAEHAWLFSRRSGPFWQGLGFARADRDELAVVLAGTTQVELFRSTGQLAHEVAWRRPLAPTVPHAAQPGSVGA